jgi:hypothetical protein
MVAERSFYLATFDGCGALTVGVSGCGQTGAIELRVLVPGQKQWATCPLQLTAAIALGQALLEAVQIATGGGCRAREEIHDHG